MATSMIPVDPDKRDDTYYRYKMPAIQTKVEGSGNGIKTVFPNIHDVCLAINRPEEVLMKYFQSEFGAQSTVSEKDDKFLIMGSHTEERVQEKVYDFIRRFVLCRKCRNPETQLSVERNKKGAGLVNMWCGACGKSMKLDDLGARYVTVLVTYFSKNPQAAIRKGAGAAEARKKENDQQGGEAAEAAEQSPAKTERAEVKKSDLPEIREPPEQVLARFMEVCEGNDDSLLRHAMELMSTYNLKEKFGPPLVLKAIAVAEKEFMAGLRRYRTLLKRFATLPDSVLYDASTDEVAKTERQKRKMQLQATAIDQCARICIKKGDPGKLVVALFVLFIEGVLEGDCIKSWYNEKRTLSTVDGEAFMSARLAVKPFVLWLDLDENAPRTEGLGTSCGVSSV